MAPLSVPIASRLPSSLRIAPTNAAVTRVVGRLSRPSLLSLALDWLDEGNQALTAPYLRPKRRVGGNNGAGGADDDGDENDDNDDDDDDDFYPPAPSLEALREHYADLQTRKGSKREVLDRILEGDWRHGLSMYQLAMADLQYLYDHPTSQKWTAFQIVPLRPESDGSDGDDGGRSVAAVVDKASLVVPRFHPSSFLRNLQAQILPDVKVHYNLDRHKHLPLLLLRIFVLDSPYNTSLAASAPDALESSRTIYIAFPDASPFVYLSSAQSAAAAASPAGDLPGGGGAPAAEAPAPSRGEARSLRSLVVEAIPKALSRPCERYALKPTNLATRNLAELLQRRGAGRTNTAGGGWSIYADEKVVESPLSLQLPPSVSALLDGRADDAAKTKPPAAAQPLPSGKPPQKRPASPGADREQRLAKRRKQVAAARFGPSAQMGDGLGVERVDVVLHDPFPGGRRFDWPSKGGDNDSQDGQAGEPGDDGPPNRRRSRGGRRSQIYAALLREDEEEEAGETADQALHEDEPDEQENGSDTGESSWRPRVALTFHGPHVFAGVRQLVEAGVIDGEKMPGWLTGEEGVTVGVVRHGRIRGHKGSGML